MLPRPSYDEILKKFSQTELQQQKKNQCDSELYNISYTNSVKESHEIARLKTEIKHLKQTRSSNNNMFGPNNRNLRRSKGQSI